MIPLNNTFYIGSVIGTNLAFRKIPEGKEKTNVYPRMLIELLNII